MVLTALTFVESTQSETLVPSAQSSIAPLLSSVGVMRISTKPASLRIVYRPVMTDAPAYTTGISSGVVEYIFRQRLKDNDTETARRPLGLRTRPVSRQTQFQQG